MHPPHAIAVGRSIGAHPHIQHETKRLLGHSLIREVHNPTDMQAIVMIIQISTCPLYTFIVSTTG